MTELKGTWKQKELPSTKEGFKVEEGTELKGLWNRPENAYSVSLTTDYRGLKIEGTDEIILKDKFTPEMKTIHKSLLEQTYEAQKKATEAIKPDYLGEYVSGLKAQYESVTGEPIPDFTNTTEKIKYTLSNAPKIIGFIAKEYAKAPLRLLATMYLPMARMAFGLPATEEEPLEVPGLGEVPTMFYQYKQMKEAGYSDFVSGLSAGSGTALDFAITLGMANVIQYAIKRPSIETVYQVKIPKSEANIKAIAISKAAKLPKPETAIRSSSGYFVQSVKIKGYENRYIIINTDPSTGLKTYFSFEIPKSNPALQIQASAFAKKFKLPEITAPKGVEFPNYNASLPGMTTWIEFMPTQAQAHILKVGIEKMIPEFTVKTSAPLPKIVPPVASISAGAITKEGGLATTEQIRQAHIIAKDKLFISEKGKPKPQYRRLAKGITGKTSMKNMTTSEADDFIDALKRLEVKFGKAPKIPISTDLITEDLANIIPQLKEIGFKERFRPSKRVFQKIGLEREIFKPAFEAEINLYEELMSFRKEAMPLKKSVSKIPESSKRIFQSLNNTLPKGVVLTVEETKVANWGKEFFDKWADKLKLPVEKRRDNYITHIFEADIEQAIKNKNPLPLDLIRAMDFITPKTIFHQFLQKRLGVEAGLKEDFWASIEAYESRSLKVYHYQPLIDRIRVYKRFLQPNSAKYLTAFIKRITGSPLAIDREIQQDFKELAGVIKKLPNGGKLAEQLTKGNASGMIAYQFTGLLYESFLGLRPSSAIKNLSQQSLIIAETGIINFSKAKGMMLTKNGKELLKESLVLRSRKLGYLPGVDETFLKGLESKRRKVDMWMFRTADKNNVSTAFLAGYSEAIGYGLPRDLAIQRGDEVAAKTQYVYTKLAGAAWSQSSGGRILSVLTTWPENWLELINDWIRAKPSEVYSDYTKKTGKKIPGLDGNWATRRKQVWRYLALVILALIVEKSSRFKATYYTGWTSLKSLANMAKGQFAGLDIPGSIAGLLAGIATFDEKLIKQNWNKLRPDRVILIIRSIEDILMGKKDWLSLFFILEDAKKDTGFEFEIPLEELESFELKEFEL